MGGGNWFATDVNGLMRAAFLGGRFSRVMGSVFSDAPSGSCFRVASNRGGNA